MTSEAIRLAIRSEPDVEITLYDAAGIRLEVREQVMDPDLRGDGDGETGEDQEAGTGAVVAAARPGLYRVHLDRCGFVCEHLIQHDSPQERFFDGPLVESPAPIEIAHPPADLAGLARQLAAMDRESARPIGTGDHDGRLVIVLYRGQGVPVASLVSEPVSIHDLTGRELVKLGADNTDHGSEPEPGYVALSCRVASGAYRLRVGNAPRDLVLAIPRGRAAQVFLADHGNVSLGTARVYLPRLEDGLDLGIARAMESVLWALRLPRGDLPRIAEALLPGADRDLSFAMACAHLMQRTLDRAAAGLDQLARQGDRGRAESDARTRRLERERTALDGVLRMLSEHANDLPDAGILAAVRRPGADATPGAAALATPPLYRASLMLALEHGLEIDPRGAFMEAVKAGHDDAVWCTWGPGLWHQLWIDPTIERLRDPGPDDSLGGARPAGPAVGVEEVVRATRLPASVVALAFRRLDAGLPRIEDRPSALAIPGYALGEITRRDERSVTAHASREDDGAQVAIQIVPAASRDALDRVSSAVVAARHLGHRQLLWIERHGVLAGGSGAWVETEPCKASLFEHLAAVGGPLPHARACNLVLPALEALEYVHGQLAVHGDIHPGNLLIRSGGSAILGLPRLASREAAGEPVATDLDGPWMRFLAPECLADPAAASPASDVWSLAATLYFALTLEPPRERYTGQDELEAARRNPVIPIRERLPGVPDLLARCLDRALSSRPDARFRDGKQFHDELARSMRASESAAQAAVLHDEMVRADPACANTIRNVFVRLSRLSDGEVGRRVARDLLRYSDDAENRRVDEVLRRFHAAGLIRLGTERIQNGADQEFVEPALDELIAGWAQIRRWLDDLDTMPGGRILVGDLERAARSWSDAQYADSLLWRDGRAKRADAIRRGHGYTCNALEEEFIRLSLHRRVTRRLGQVAIVTALVVVSGCVYWQREIAATARTDAQILARALQETGRERVLDGHPFQALPYLAAARKAEAGPALRMLFHTASRRLLPAPPLDHRDAVRRVAFSPDGARVVTASTDGTACVWDATTGVRTACIRHRGAVVSAAFSPDGARVVTASEDWTAEVWDAATGKPLCPPLPHEHFVQTASFSPDGAHVVTTSLDHTARVWSSRAGAMTPYAVPWLEHELGHRDAVWSAMFSADGTRIVTASQDGTARIWDAATGRPVGVPLEHRNAVWSAAFSADGTRIVTASQDGTARIWDAATGQAIRVPDRVTHTSNPLVLHHNDGVTSASFDPSGRYVVTTSHDSTARVWSAVDGTPVTPWLEHRGSVSAAAFSADGARVVTASEDDVARIWDARTGGLLPPILEHTGPVSSAVFDAAGKRVVTASFDGTARIWDATGDRSPVALGVDRVVRGAMFSPDATRIVTVSEDGKARIWDTADGRSAGAPLGHTAAVRTAAYSPDGRRIVTTSDDRSVRIWDAATGALAMRPLVARGNPSSAVFSADGTRIIAAGGDNDTRLQDSLQIWRADSGAEIPLRLEYPERVMSARLSGDGLRLITANDAGAARIWDAVTGKAITLPLDHPGGVISVAFNRDATRALTTGRDRTARIWDAGHGNLTAAPLAQPRGGILTAAFGPDGARIVTVSDDRSVRVWDASTGKPLTPPLRHDTAVVNAAFSADGEQLLSVDGRIVRTWDVGLDHGSPRDWANVASRSPYVLEDGVLTLRASAAAAPLAGPPRVRRPSS